MPRIEQPNEHVELTAAQSLGTSHQPNRFRMIEGLAASGITAACLIYLILSASLPSLGEAIWQADYSLLGLAMLLSLLTILCKGVRWRALYSSEGRPGLGLAVAAIAMGQVANWAAPARLGELMRIGLVSARGSAATDAKLRVAHAAGVIVAEKFIDGLMLLGAVAAFAIVAGLPRWVNAAGLTVIGLACLSMVGLVVVFKRGWQRYLVGKWPYQFLKRALSNRASILTAYVTALVDGMSAWLSRGVIMQALLWSGGAWGLGGAINYLVLASVAVSPRLEIVLAVLVALYGGAVIPSLPGRIGVFQFLCVLALTSFGVGSDQALVFSIALYLVVYLPPIVLGLLAVVFAGRSLQRLNFRGNHDNG